MLSRLVTWLEGWHARKTRQYIAEERRRNGSSERFA